MSTARIAFSFAVDGPGEDIDFSMSETLSLLLSKINRRGEAISSTSETTVWQSNAHALGSDILTYLHSAFVISVRPDDNGTLTNSDIFQIGFYTTTVSSGAAGNSGTVAFTVTMTNAGVILLPSQRCKGSTAPSSTALPDAITKVTACRQSGSNTGRVVVIATN